MCSTHEGIGKRASPLPSAASRAIGPPDGVGCAWCGVALGRRPLRRRWLSFRSARSAAPLGV